MKCKECGDTITLKELKNHLAEKHTDITEEMYRKKHLSAVKYKKKPVETVEDSTISSKLDKKLAKYNITMDMLVDALDKYFDKDAKVKVTKTISQIATEKAEELIDMNLVNTRDLHIAEALTTKFGYVVTDVSSNPKVWHLAKGK